MKALKAAVVIGLRGASMESLQINRSSVQVSNFLYVKTPCSENVRKRAVLMSIKLLKSIQ